MPEDPLKQMTNIEFKYHCLQIGDKKRGME